jgi:hypothetical protein
MHIASLGEGVYRPSIDFLMFSRRRPEPFDLSPDFELIEGVEFTASDFLPESQSRVPMEEYVCRLASASELCRPCSNEGIGTMTLHISEGRVRVPGDDNKVYRNARRVGNRPFLTHMDTYFNPEHDHTDTICQVVETMLHIAEAMRKQHDGIVIENYNAPQDAHVYGSQIHITRARAQLMQDIRTELDERMQFAAARSGPYEFSRWMP